jgi:hypothetical protein
MRGQLKEKEENTYFCPPNKKSSGASKDTPDFVRCF